MSAYVYYTSLISAIYTYIRGSSQMYEVYQHKLVIIKLKITASSVRDGPADCLPSLHHEISISNFISTPLNTF